MAMIYIILFLNDSRTSFPKAWSEINAFMFDSGGGDHSIQACIVNFWLY